MEAQRDVSDEELEEQKRKTSIRRYLSTLKSLQSEISQDRSLPKGKLAELNKLIKKLEDFAKELL